MRRLGATVGLLLLVAGCMGEGPERSGDPALDADVRVSPTPAVIGQSRVFVRATDDGQPLVDGEVTVRIEAVDTAGGGVPQPSGALAAGVDHPAPPLAESPGDYGPLTLHFPAPGRWRVEVRLQVGERSTRLSVPLAVVGAATGPSGG
jgi:hypothetical protein